MINFLVGPSCIQFILYKFGPVIIQSKDLKEFLENSPRLILTLVQQKVITQNLMTVQLPSVIIQELIITRSVDCLQIFSRQNPSAPIAFILIKSAKLSTHGETSEQIPFLLWQPVTKRISTSNCNSNFLQLLYIRKHIQDINNYPQVQQNCQQY